MRVSVATCLVMLGPTRGSSSDRVFPPGPSKNTLAQTQQRGHRKQLETECPNTATRRHSAHACTQPGAHWRWCANCHDANPLYHDACSGHAAWGSWAGAAVPAVAVPAVVTLCWARVRRPWARPFAEPDFRSLKALTVLFIRAVISKHKYMDNHTHSHKDFLCSQTNPFPASVNRPVVNLCSLTPG